MVGGLLFLEKELAYYMTVLALGEWCPTPEIFKGVRFASVVFCICRVRALCPFSPGFSVAGLKSLLRGD